MPVTVPRFDVATFLSQSALDTTHIDAIVAAFDRTGVISGCVTTATGTTMVLTVSAGKVEIAGQTINVAGGTVTAIADGTNPRRSLISVNASGTLTLTSGTPLAAATGDPAIPAIPANSCPLCVVYIPAGVTALNATHLTECRVIMRQNFDAVTFYADDYASVEACVAAANASVTAGALGATVLLGPKNYTTVGIDIGKYVSIVGNGAGRSRITAANGINRPVIRGVNFLTLTGTAKQTPELRGDNYVALTGFTIDGNKTNQTSGTTGGVQIWGKNLLFHDLMVVNCFGHGLWTEYTDQYDIANFPERERMESYYDEMIIAGCTGNGWEYRGPHDAHFNNSSIYECAGWALNLNTVGDSIAGIVLHQINAYLCTTGCFRVYGDLKDATAVVASGNAIGTGWDFNPASGGVKMTGCDTFGFVKGLILRGNSHYYSGNISGNWDATGATMGVGLIVGDGTGGAYNCIVDADGTGNDIAINFGGDWGANRISGTWNVPTAKAQPTSPSNASLFTGSPAYGASDYNIIGLQGAATLLLQSKATGYVAGQFGIVDDTDNTKKLLHNVAGIATATTRTWTAPDASGIVVLDTAAQLLTNKLLQPRAGTATAGTAPEKFAAGTNLTAAEVGAVEFDGVQFYDTIDTTSGRGARPTEQYFHLTAAGSTISTIANFFGATSNIALVASAYYLIDIELFYLKTTAGTVTWTLTNSVAPTGQNIDYEMSPITGIVAPPGTAATMLQGQFYNDATAARTIVTGSLTTGVEHYAKMRIWLKNGTGTSLKIQATASAGSITPGIGSMWRCRRLSPNNIGTFAT